VRRRERRHNAGHDRWLVSYADFITLLFGFFVVLYAFARADQKKQTQVADSIDTAFRSLGLFSEPAKPSTGGSAAGAESTVIPADVAMGEDVQSPARVKSDLERLGRELTDTLSSQVEARTVSIHMGRDGLVISLREAGFFASGSATPKPDSLRTLRRIASSLGRIPYDLRVEGHSDDIPIHTAEFDSNWELSGARAARIARIFVELKAMPPERISAAGYAQFHPVASNSTEEGRAENRRVDLVVLPQSKIDLSSPALSVPSGAWRKVTD
jgi:chemotaxis protein MotB